LSLFGHVARMGDDRKLKTVIFEVMEGKNKRGRPHRMGGRHKGWGEDTLQKLYYFGADYRDGWRRKIKLTLEAYEHDAHGA